MTHVTINWTPEVPEEDNSYWHKGRNGMAKFRGLALWTNTVGEVYLDQLTTRGVLRGGSCAPATVVDALCRQWLEARGYSVVEPDICAYCGDCITGESVSTFCGSVCPGCLKDHCAECEVCRAEFQGEEQAE